MKNLRALVITYFSIENKEENKKKFKKKNWRLKIKTKKSAEFKKTEFSIHTMQWFGNSKKIYE